QTFRRNVDVVEYMILPTRHPEGTIGCLFGASFQEETFQYGFMPLERPAGAIGCLFGASVKEETFQYGFMPLERPAGAIGSLFGTSAQDELFNTDLCRSNVPQGRLVVYLAPALKMNFSTRIYAARTSRRGDW